MKKVLGVLVTLLMASSAMGAVNVTVADTGGGWAEISYDATAEPNLPRAFALRIEVDAGTIDAVQFSMGESAEACPGDECEPFDIYPGNIQIAENGDVTSYGSPVAPLSAPDNPPQLPSTYIIVEMGSLYAIPGNAPAASGLLMRAHCTANCDMTVSEEFDVRGGVVLEDPDIDPTVNGDTETIVLGCFYKWLDIPCNGPVHAPKDGSVANVGAVTQAQYDAWVANSRPAKWCSPCFGCGDYSDDCVIDFSADVTQGIKAAWPNYHPDVDHSRDGVLDFSADVGRIKDAWLNPPQEPSKCPPPCLANP